MHLFITETKVSTCVVNQPERVINLNLNPLMTTVLCGKSTYINSLRYICDG